MNKPLFFCDLDQTMIYSSRLVDKFTGTYNGLAVVETHAKKPHSFMTLNAVNVLQELSKEVVFIPCSTRSPTQFERVYVPSVIVKHTILDNGGKIYTNSIEDKNWTKKMHEEIDSSSKAPSDVYSEITAMFGKEEWFNKIRITSNMFVAVIAYDKVPTHFIEYVESQIKDWNYTYSVQSRSIYMIPNAVTKEKAAQEVSERYDSEEIFAAGDSVLDLGLLEFAKHSIRPAHGELFDKGLAPHIRSTTKSGIQAGEQILEFVTLTVR